MKLAQPGRPVVALSGDGSAMYSIQALWTAAHHDLAVVFVILNNREYRILKHNMDTYRQRFGAKPDRAYPNMDLVSPDLGFVDLARGMGVEAMRVATPGELRPALQKALAPGGLSSWTSPSRGAPDGEPGELRPGSGAVRSSPDGSHRRSFIISITPRNQPEHTSPRARYIKKTRRIAIPSRAQYQVRCAKKRQKK